jgi:tRNA(Ile)-lysidine synthase
VSLSESALRQRVRRTIRRDGLCPAGSQVLVGISGGSDSVALLWLLYDLTRSEAFTIVGLAHLNHQLRDTADRDEHFCRGLADRVGLPIVVNRQKVRDIAESQRTSIEVAARKLRYSFLMDARAELGADRIAVGHTLDDQAETLLLKLVRGSGMRGLAGIFPSKGRIIRPLLDVTRDELRVWLNSRGERWVDDESNRDLTNPRNLTRHVVLPQLDRCFGGSVRRAAARAARLAREDGEYLDAVATGLFGSVCTEQPDSLAVDAISVRRQPVPVARRLLLTAMRRCSRTKEIGLEHVESALDVLIGRVAAVEVPGGRWELRGEKLVLLRRAVSTAPARVTYSYLLSVPGAAEIAEARCLIVAEPCNWNAVREDAPVRSGKGTAAAVRLSDVHGLRVRSRRPGDRVRPPGLNGRRKLQDLFVDACVPRDQRDRAPLVVDAHDRIVWVPEHTVCADFQVSGGEDGVILLKLTRLGGKA